MKMNRIIVLILLVLAALCTIVVAQKLQIVVENNVDDCDYRVQNGDRVYTYYTGTFEDGSVFDSNVGAKPYTFTLGAHQVIKGMDQGTLGMCVGEKRRLVIPPELAYGEYGYGDVIPPDSTLIFETEVVKIIRKDEL